MLNNIIYLKYLNKKDLLKTIKFTNYRIDKYQYELIIERLYSEDLISTSDLIFNHNIQDDLKKLKIIEKYNNFNFEDIKQYIIEHFIYQNNYECLKFLIQKNIKILEKDWILKLSIIHNCYECFIYLIENDFELNERTFYYILEYDRILFLKYLYENKYKVVYKDNIVYCSKSNTMNCLIYLIEVLKINVNWTIECSYNIIKNNNIDYLKYAIFHGCPIDKKTFSLCVDYCDLIIVKYLVSLNCPFDIEAMNNAAENNDLKCIQYLRSINCPWNESTTETACEYGHYRILKYLIKNGCNYDKESLYYASKNGKIKCLLYLIKNGLTLNEDVFTNLIYFGNIDYLKTIYDLNCPYNKNTSLSNALFKKNNDIILFLYKKGFRCNNWVNKTNLNYLEKLLSKNDIKLKNE